MKQRLEEYGGFVDVGILRHGFAPHMRDYDVVFEALWGKEKWADRKGRYLLRFSHCPEALTSTAVNEASWRTAWDDVFIDHAAWIAAGEPEGFVWGACWSTAYPGLSYLDGSPRAERWSERLGRTMHEVKIETEAFEIRIVFNDFTVKKLNDTVEVVDKAMFPVDAVDEDEPSGAASDPAGE